MQSNEERSKNQVRIIELSETIEQLSAELSRRLNIEYNSNGISSADRVVSPATLPIVIPQAEGAQAEEALTGEAREFAVGDLVEITNNYRNLRGQQGHVVKVTRRQVMIKLANSNNQVVRRNKANVQFIQQNE